MGRNHQNFLDAYLNFTEKTEGSERVHKWVALSMIAGVMERRYWYQYGHHTIYPNLYVVLVGPAGIVRKSSSTAIGINILNAVGDMHFIADKSSAASVFRELHDASTSFNYKGEEIKMSSGFIYATELKNFMGEVFGSHVEALISFYDCFPNDPKVPFKYSLIKDGGVKLYGPCLNLLGCTTPADLPKCIPSEQLYGGLASRIIFIHERKMTKEPVAFPETPPNYKEARQALIQDLAHIHSNAGEFEIDSDAKLLFSEWYKHHMKEVVPLNSDHRFEGYLGRKHLHVLKISMLLSIAKSDSLLITKYDIKEAVELVEGLESDLFKIFDKKEVSKKEDQEFKIIKFLHEACGIDREILATNIFEKFHDEMPVELIEKNIVSLAKQGFIKIKKCKDPSSGRIFEKVSLLT